MLAVLHQLGIKDFEVTPIQMSDMKSKWFLDLNPWGQIPTLQDADYTLGESSAIVSYIL